MTFNDRFISGAIAGTIAAIAKTIPNFIFNLLGVTNHTYPSLIAAILLKTPHPHSFWPFFLGLVIDAIIGGVVGIVIAYILKTVGNKYLWLKGIIFGNLVWLIGPTILLPLFYSGITISFQYVSLFDHWILGLAMVYLIVKFYPNGK